MSLENISTPNILKPETVELLQYRINEEEKSARLYESMSLWLNNAGYLGASALWKKYSLEELEHASWSKNLLLDFGIKPELRLIPVPTKNYNGLCEIIQLSLQHEILISNQCTELSKKAFLNGDLMVFELGLRYNREQVEEIGKLQTFLDQLNTFGEDKIALRLLDTEMSKLA